MAEYEFKKYSLEAIRAMADDARKRTGSKEIPIDIEKLIEFGYGITIVPLRSLKSGSDIEGFLSNDMTEIFVDYGTYNEARFESRLRFTLAHELGHRVLHSEFYNSVKFKNVDDWMNLIDDLHQDDIDWYERHANEFAGRLLVPLDHLMQAIEPYTTQLKSAMNKAADLGLSNDEIYERSLGFISGKLAPKFKVVPMTIEIRIKREKINLNSL